MNILKRLFRLGKAETHSVIDQLEDPIKMTEQGIREMKEQLDKAIQAMASVKAMAIRAKNDTHNAKNQAEDYQNKAMIILKRAANGDFNQEEADRLAKEALNKKQQATENAQVNEKNQIKYETDVEKMQKNINSLKSNISKWENELKTLKARVKVSEATKDINKQMAAVDSSSTISLLEKMKEKVEEQEALADAYGDIVDSSKSVDDEIDKAIDQSDINADLELQKLKDQLK